MGLEQDQLFCGATLSCCPTLDCCKSICSEKPRGNRHQVQSCGWISCTGRPEDFQQCLGSVLEGALCSWVLMDKGGQSLALLQMSSSRCVLVCAVSDHGKHCKALVSFPQRILTATCLVWKTCLSRYCFCCVQWSGWFFYHTYQNNTSAPFRSASGDVIAIPRGLLVLTVSPVGRMHILKCLALYFNTPVGLPGKGRGQEGLRLHGCS